MDGNELIFYLSAALIIYYVFRELFDSKNDSSSRWLLLFLILLLFGYFAWSYYKNKQFEDEAQETLNSDMCDSDSEKGGYVQDDVIVQEESLPSEYEKQELNLEMQNFPTEESSEMTYEIFKNWYLTSDFISKYTQAMKKSCIWYKKRLIETRNRFIEDLKTIKPKNDPSPLTQLLDRNDDTKIIESTITELQTLYKEIQEKEKFIDENYCKKCLIDALTNRKHGIDSLIGRTDIKNFLALRLYAFSQNPMTFLTSYQNIELHGDAGAGKTKIAEVIGHVYATSGMLIRSHTHIITKQALTTAYVNESAKMTRKLLLANLGGVVFIDEAYDLGSSSNFGFKSINHGEEAIVELVNFIDKMKGLSLIIVAGYEDKMNDQFRSANEGIPRRFPFVHSLKPYNSVELTNISIQFMRETCPYVQLTKTHANLIYSYIDYLYETHPEVFVNQAGSCSNLVGCISRSIYGSPGKNWLKNSEELLLNGINTYLRPSNISINKNFEIS